MTRVVIDTNILVSALLQPRSPPAAVLMLALSGRVQLCLSDAIFSEYEDVIRRPHLKRPADVIEGALASLWEIGHWVKPVDRVEECSDPDDNVFLECAEAAGADYLATGNQRHFRGRRRVLSVLASCSNCSSSKRTRVPVPCDLTASRGFVHDS